MRSVEASYDDIEAQTALSLYELRGRYTTCQQSRKFKGALILIGVCRNWDCTARKMNVQIQFPIQPWKYNFKKISENKICPSCNIRLASKDIKAIGFNSCTFKFKAVTPQGQKVSTCYTRAPSDKFIYFLVEEMQDLTELKIYSS